jgi:hypothetical protein
VPASWHLPGKKSSVWNHKVVVSDLRRDGFEEKINSEAEFQQNFGKRKKFKPAKN